MVSGLFEERAIILGRLGRHEQALSIYVSVLSDIQRAKEYCDKVYKQGGPGADEVSSPAFTRNRLVYIELTFITTTITNK